MTTKRVIAIAAIYILATVAWATLGTSILARTGEFDSRLGEQVAQLWGGQHRQVSPSVWVERQRDVTEQVADGVNDGKTALQGGQEDRDRPRSVAALTQSRVKADLRLTHRQKGLLWYDTYDVGFTGRFVARNPDAVAAHDRRRAPLSLGSGASMTGSCFA